MTQKITVSNASLRHLIDDGTTVQQLAGNWGVSPSSIHHWIRNEAAIMPRYAQVLVEHTNHKNNTTGYQLFIVSVPAKSAEFFRLFSEGFGVAIHEVDLPK